MYKLPSLCDDRHRKGTCGCQGEGGGGRGMDWELGISRYKLVYIEWINKSLLCSTGLLFSPVWLFATPWTAGYQTSLPSLSPGVCLNSCPLTRWCHPTTSSSVAPFSSCPQSFPESGSFPMSRLFASGDQSIAASASASVLPMNIQDQFPLGLIGLISLQSKELSRVFFSSTTVWKHQLLGTLPCHMVQLTWLLENHSFD